MTSDVTEWVYAQKLYGINLWDDDVIRGGIEYPSNYRFGDIIRVVASDYFQYISPGQEAVAPIMTFQNGYTLKVHMIIKTGSRPDLDFILEWYDENDEYVEGIHRSGAILFTLDAIPQFTFFFSIYTGYPANPVEGTTNAQNITFNIMYFDQLPRGYDSELINYGITTTGGEIQTTARTVLNDNSVRFNDLGFLSYTDIETFSEWLHGRGLPFTDPVFPDEPPAGGDDNSGPGGGGGDYGGGGGTPENPWVRNSDPIDFPDLPSGGALASGAIMGYVVGQQTLTALFQKLWSTSIFDIATWQKLISEPLDCIISLHCLPYEPTTGNTGYIGIGSFDTEIAAPRITSEYMYIDCGSLHINSFWGSALDYSPYTRCELFLPFIGIKDIATEDVMNQTIHIKYAIDCLTGDCIAHVKCGQSVIYKFKGNMRMPIPLSSKTTDMWMRAALGTAAIAGTVATGGSGAAIAGTSISAAGSVATSKVRTSRGGDISGTSGFLDDFRPFFIFHRPAQSLAKNYNKFKGYTSNISSKLSSLSGYTEVEHIHLTGIIGATDTELEEIETLLKEGVII